MPCSARRITNVRDLVGSLPVDRLERRIKFERALKIAAKNGIAIASDGRCYVPESQRGRGVGYGRHGKG